MLDIKRLYLMPHILLLGFSIVLLGELRGSSAGEILINNRESLATGFVAAPLVAIRPVTNNKDNLFLASKKISKDLIVESATSFPEIRTNLARLGVVDPINMPMSDFVDVIKSSGYPDKYLYTPETPWDSAAKYPVVVSRFAQSGSGAWDARTLTNMVVTGIIDTDSTNVEIIGGNEVEWFSIDGRYAGPLYEVYRGFWYFRAGAPPAYVGRAFASLKEDVTNYDALQRSLLENIGDITFGIPVIYSASEKGLKVPKSVTKSYDVYWADLVVTYRGVNPDDLAEMAFNVVVPEGSLALKLVPLRFGVQISREEKEAAPKIGIEYGGAKVSIGEYFAQMVAYTYLKPTIEGYGEGERNFSWTMTGPAISGGSHRFAAILRVPKGTQNIDFGFSGHVRLRKSFIGEWYDGELVAGTDAWVVPVSF